MTIKIFTLSIFATLSGFNFSCWQRLSYVNPQRGSEVEEEGKRKAKNVKKKVTRDRK
jgi:hypothetical protein